MLKDFALTMSLDASSIPFFRLFHSMRYIIVRMKMKWQNLMLIEAVL